METDYSVETSRINEKVEYAIGQLKESQKLYQKGHYGTGEKMFKEALKNLDQVAKTRGIDLLL